MGPSGGFDVLQRDHLAGVLLADRSAEKGVAVEQPDLGQVARVVADGHRLAHESRERGRHVAQPLEVDAITPDSARRGVQEQQEVKLFQGFGQTREKPLAAPCIERSSADLAMNPVMVGAID